MKIKFKERNEMEIHDVETFTFLNKKKFSNLILNLKLLVKLTIINRNSEI